MEFTAEDAQTLIRVAWAILSSPLAQRIYVLLAGLAVLIGCLMIAIWADRRGEENISAAEVEFGRKFPGPKPKSTKAVANRRRFYSDIARRIHGAALFSLLVSFVAGVLVPTAILYVMTIHYTWFDPIGDHLLNAMRQPVSSLSPADARLFVLDQSMRGGFFDLLEVFDRDVTLIDNNPTNLWFSGGLFAYHLMLEAFVFSGIWLYFKTVRRLNVLERGATVPLEAAAGPTHTDTAPASAAVD